jgi:hypothetical protein
VQIYNPGTNAWSVGSPVPNNQIYKSFGASGVVLSDTIYYFGGAKSSFGFNIQNTVRKGVINPNDPTQIVWSFEAITPSTVGYRMAVTAVGQTLHWLGGSTTTYNFDGIAYNGTGGVSPSNRDLYTNSDLANWQERFVQELPMDLRGIATVNDSVKFIGGGMINNQEVTDKVYKLTWDLTFLGQNELMNDFRVHFYPMPFNDYLTIESDHLNQPVELEIYNMAGQLVFSKHVHTSEIIIETSIFESGVYIARVRQDGKIHHQKLIKTAK